MKAQKLILGNVITMDSVKPFAKAITLVDGRIQYVGSVNQAKLLCDDNTVILDYGDNYIYPGFMDAHTHGLFAGYRSLGQADLTVILPPTYDGYREVITKFINNNPDKDIYVAAGWAEDGKTIFTRSFLDEICSNKPLIMNTMSGHSILLNTKAMEFFEVDKDFAAKYGKDLVRVDENGEPTGYICETPAIAIIQSLKISDENARKYIKDWQKFAFSKGFTGAVDAGFELISKNALDAYIYLNDNDELKLYSFGYLMCDDNLNNPKEKALEIFELAKKHNGKHFKILGAKVFLDGVVEAHTAWLCDEYSDNPGYYGNQRFNDLDSMTELIAETGKLGLAVHAHSDGDGATKFFLDAVVKGQTISGNMDQRNAAAHLQLLRDEDIQRMADTNTIAVVPPLWVPKLPGAYEQECGYIGKKRNDSVYPIKSFIDKGALIVFHSDYPISPTFDAARSVYVAVKRTVPEGILEGVDGEYSLRGEGEAISRYEALKALTTNVAYMIHEEDNLGSISTGKIANFSILDKDLLNDDMDDIFASEVIATVVDGDEVYHK